MTLTDNINGRASEEDKSIESRVNFAPRYNEAKYPVYLTPENLKDHKNLEQSIALIAAGTRYRINQQFIDEGRNTKVKYEIMKKGLFGEKPVLSAYFFERRESDKPVNMIEVEFDNHTFSKSDLETTMYLLFPDKIIELDDYQYDIKTRYKKKVIVF